MKKLKLLGMLMMLTFFAVGCAGMGATNTTATNVMVTSYEATGATLTQAFNVEKMLLTSGVITPEQDAQFQLGVYTDAFNCYRAIGSAAVAVLTATDSAGKTTAMEKFNALKAQLPDLITKVLTFIQEVQKK
jgi:hypothetical protein